LQLDEHDPTVPSAQAGNFDAAIIATAKKAAAEKISMILRRVTSWLPASSSDPGLAGRSRKR
jgi:hypothetical protein